MSEDLQGQLLAEQGEAPNENHDNCVSCYWFLGEICDGNPNTQLAFAQMSDKLADKIGDPDLAFQKVLEYKEGKITLLDIENFVTEHLARSEAKPGQEKAEKNEIKEQSPLEKKFADKFAKLNPAEIAAIRTEQAAARAEVTANAKEISEVTYTIQARGTSIDLLNQGSGQNLLDSFTDGTSEGAMNRNEYSGHLQGLINGNFVIIDCYGSDGELIGKTFYEHNPEDGLVYCVAALVKGAHTKDQDEELKLTPNTPTAEKGKSKVGVKAAAGEDSGSASSREAREAATAAAAAQDQREQAGVKDSPPRLVPVPTEIQMSANQWAEYYDSDDYEAPSLHIGPKAQSKVETYSINTRDNISYTREATQSQLLSEQAGHNLIDRETMVTSENAEHSAGPGHEIYLSAASITESADTRNVELQGNLAQENGEDQIDHDAPERRNYTGSIRNPKLVDKIQQIYFGDKSDALAEKSAQTDSNTLENSAKAVKPVAEIFGIQLATDLDIERISEATVILPEDRNLRDERNTVLFASQDGVIQNAERMAASKPDIKSDSDSKLEIEQEIAKIPTRYETGISLALSGLREEIEQVPERVLADADTGVNLIAQERKAPTVRAEKSESTITLETAPNFKPDNGNSPDNFPTRNERTELVGRVLDSANERAERIVISRAMIEKSSGISLTAEAPVEVHRVITPELGIEQKAEPQAIKLSAEHIPAKETARAPEPIVFTSEKSKQEPIELQRVVLDLLITGLEKSLQSLQATVDSISELGKKPESVRAPEIHSTFNLNSRYPSQGQLPKQQTRRQPLNPKAAKVLRIAA